MLTFPVNHGQTVNVVAFHTSEQDWPDPSRLVAPAKREDALRDFKDFGHSVTKLLQLSQPELDVVSTPVPSWSNLTDLVA